MKNQIIILLLLLSYQINYDFREKIMDSKIDIKIFDKLPSKAFTVNYDDKEGWYYNMFQVKELNNDSITFYAQRGWNFPSRRFIKLTMNKESHLIVLADDNQVNEKAGFIKWKTENEVFVFSDTTTITTSFKEEYIKLLFPSYKGKIIISKANRIKLIQNNGEKLGLFMGFRLRPDKSKENLL